LTARGDEEESLKKKKDDSALKKKYDIIQFEDVSPSPNKTDLSVQIVKEYLVYKYTKPAKHILQEVYKCTKNGHIPLKHHTCPLTN
jgi:hypothetical protein